MLAVYLLLIQFCIVIFQEWRNEEMALIDEKNGLSSFSH